MTGCTSCGAPFGPGDRRCGSCGTLRSAPTPAGTTVEAGPPAVPHVVARSDASDRGAEPVVVVGARGARRWVVAAAVAAVGCLAAAAVVATRRGPSGPETVWADDLARVLPPAIVRAPTLRWREPRFGVAPDPSGGVGGLLVDQDDTHVVIVVPTDPRRVTARLTSDGTTSWSKRLPGAATALGIVGATVYVTTDDGLAAFDAATGTQRWWAPEVTYVLPTWPGGPLLAHAGRSEGFTVSVLDPVTGHATWSTAGSQLWRSRRGLVVAPADCRLLSLLDWDDGHAMWTYRTGLEACPHGGTSGLHVAGAGERLVAEVGDEWVGLDLATGAERWRAPRGGVSGGSLRAFDDAHVLVYDAVFPGDAHVLRPADEPIGVLIDAGTGALARTDVQVEQPVRIGRRGGPDRLFALTFDGDGSQLRTIDGHDQRFTAPSMPVQADLRSVYALWAMAEDTTYAVDGLAGSCRLTAYSMSSGARRWTVGCGAGVLVSVGRVLVLVDGEDLVVYA